MTFGEYIKKIRKTLNLKAFVLAEKLNIRPAYMSDIELEKRYPPTQELLEKMIDILSASPKFSRKEFIELAVRSDNPKIAWYFRELRG